MSIAIIGSSRTWQKRVLQLLSSEQLDCRTFDCVSQFVGQTTDGGPATAVLGRDGEYAETIGSIRLLRSISPATAPIVVVSEHGSDADEIAALDAGADHYLRLPLAGRLLAARLTSLRNRLENASIASAAPQIRVGSYELDVSGRFVTFHGVRRHLSPNAFKLAAILFSNPNRAISADHIREMIWGATMPESSRALVTLASRLRDLLELTPNSDVYLTPVYGVGYRLNTAHGSVRETSTRRWDALSRTSAEHVVTGGLPYVRASHPEAG